MSKLGECLTIKHGWAFKGEFFAESGEQSILTPGNFYEAGGFKYNDERERYYTGEYPHEYLCKKGDLIVAMTEQAAGLLGSTAIVPKDNRYLHNQRIGLITCDEKHITKMFAYYLFMTKSVREQISRTSSGTKVKHTSPEKIYDVEVSLPDIPTQKKIAHFLWTIDCKIRNNIQINDNLQHQLKLLYDYWFTQFDFPDENGKPYRASGGTMVWCDELQREIPKGWKVSTLSDIAVLQAKSVIPQEGTAYNHYSIPAFDDTHSPAVEDGKAIASNKYVVPDNSVLVSKLNPQFKRIWLIIDSTDNAICSTEFLPVKATETGVYALYSLLNSDAFSVHLIQNASSSTGSRKRIDPDNCMSYKFPYDQKVFARFDKAIQPLLMKITGIPTETQALVALRDWLLPMLMNGQATISD
ncbi:restriction endonuclease subunit S [Ruminococcus albus]|nr:restriction endonuclease subunit S [Ruminococcus albus]MCC3350774.1 restriction endonuclease subunit S [Ruminococcus albus 8]